MRALCACVCVCVCVGVCWCLDKHSNPDEIPEIKFLYTPLHQGENILNKSNFMIKVLKSFTL